MFTRTFSAEEADLSLLPEPDVFDAGAGDGTAPDDAASGPFGETGEQDPWRSSDTGADDPAGDPYTPDGDPGDPGDICVHDDHDQQGGWDLFGGDV
ncbi:hypothetical protein ACFOWE_27510 [Planomonospora corallina]|uniref:Uncharacterized protein n=1 Tax=Planomonospora corallina TaxID=1806052 RepID=A0ABV8IGE3_9ACTN